MLNGIFRGENIARLTDFSEKQVRRTHFEFIHYSR